MFSKAARLDALGVEGAKMQAQKDISEWIRIESKIYDSLGESTDELAHAECFYAEQRAALYAILQAIKTDTANHRQTIELLAAKLAKDIPDA